MRNEINEENVFDMYYEWLLNFVCDRYHKKYYTKLLEALMTREFTYLIERDASRWTDGIELRQDFMDQFGVDDIAIAALYQTGCTVLEMMVGLSLRIERDIMSDPDMGSQAERWFWYMVDSLGLRNMDDARYDEDQVQEHLDIALERRYRPDGHGGFFLVRGTTKDLRKAEIWMQMNWYLASL